MKRTTRITGRRSAPRATAVADGELIETVEPSQLASVPAKQPDFFDADDPLLCEPGAVSYAAYAEVLKDAGITLDQAADWLRQRKCRGTPEGVKRHRKQFSTILQDARQAAIVSVSLVAAASDMRPAKLAEACAVLVEQKLLQAIYRQLSDPAGEVMSQKAWREMLSCVNVLLGNRLKVASLSRRGKHKSKGKTASTTAAAAARELAGRFHAVLIAPNNNVPPQHIDVEPFDRAEQSSTPL